MVILPLIYTHGSTHTHTHTLNTHTGTGEERLPAAASGAADEGYRVERERNIKRRLTVLPVSFCYVNKRQKQFIQSNSIPV